ncbi:MAG: serine hydrolase [bacterium]|nr:serine hydrolase [bacterium]
MSKLFIFILSLTLLFCTSGHLSPGQEKTKAPVKLVTGGNIPTLEILGFNSKQLDKALKYAGKIPRLTGFLVAKDNTLAVEKYYRGSNRKKAVNIKSASKGIVSALVGIAIEKKYIKGIDEKIAQFLPKVFNPHWPTDKKAITIKHLVTMTSGLESTSIWNYGAWVTSKNWIRYALTRKLVHRPGKTFSYSTGNSHLLSAILTKATRMSLLSFARKHLFTPLGIPAPYWEKDPQGIYFGGNNLSLTPRDMVKFGILYLNNGKYNGKQVVPNEWVKTSTSLQVVPGRNWLPFEQRGYGYHWWLYRFGKHDTFLAWGYGGQFLFAFPGLNLVVVITSTQPASRSSARNYKQILTLMEDYLLPSIRPSR